jgi:hypothetical protein
MSALNIGRLGVVDRGDNNSSALVKEQLLFKSQWGFFEGATGCECEIMEGKADWLADKRSIIPGTDY